MTIFCKGKIKGEKGTCEAEFFLNSGSDYVILPKTMAERISPDPVGEEEFILADGSVIRRRVHRISVEVEDHRGERRECEALCTIEERPDAALGFEVMQKLKLSFHPSTGKAYFEE
jgi:predicted aspartyl protease